MLDKILRALITLLFAIVGGVIFHFASPDIIMFVGTEVLSTDMGVFKLTVGNFLCILSGVVLIGLIGFFLSVYLIRDLKRLTAWFEAQMSKMPIGDIVAGASGLIVGLIVANLLGFAFAKIPFVGDYLPVVFSIILGYLGVHITIKKRKEIAGLFDFVPRTMREILRSREKSPGGKYKEQSIGQFPSKQYKLLDTSVIIDGRIADICETGFIEGTILIPVFVLEELQHIADSADILKRTRGRRGLDILQRIRTESKMNVEISNTDFDDIIEVDSKLVRLAQKVGGKILTNDFNLNKVAQLRGVEVLNINALSNAVKPVVIPGESMQVTVVKDGKEPGQGVAYLDDGTMIVVENGRKHMGSSIDVEVTSALQTAAGRMIFAKPRF